MAEIFDPKTRATMICLIYSRSTYIWFDQRKLCPPYNNIKWQTSMALKYFESILCENKNEVIKVSSSN